jgi:hypothetical protein
MATIASVTTEEAVGKAGAISIVPVVTPIPAVTPRPPTQSRRINAGLNGVVEFDTEFIVSRCHEGRESVVGIGDHLALAYFDGVENHL